MDGYSLVAPMTDLIKYPVFPLVLNQTNSNSRMPYSTIIPWGHSIVQVPSSMIFNHN